MDSNCSVKGPGLGKSIGHIGIEPTTGMNSFMPATMILQTSVDGGNPDPTSAKHWCMFDVTLEVKFSSAMSPVTLVIRTAVLLLKEVT